MRRLPLVLIAAAVAALTAPALAADSGAPRLVLPLACEVGRTCEVQTYVDHDPGPGAQDYRCAHRTNQGHDATDIRLLSMAAQQAGVDVLAAASGRVIRLRDGVMDISVHAPGAPPVGGQACGNAVVIDHGEGWQTIYCHMAKGSLKVKVGDTVTSGQAIGRVGLSGDTQFPHLHFGLRHGGQVVDPFAPGGVSPGACAPQEGLWTPQAAKALAYKRGVLLASGFEAALSTLDATETGPTPALPTDPPALVAYGFLSGLEAGDVVEMKVLGPDGGVIATATQTLDRDKAEWLSQAGRKRPANGWAHGNYRAELTVRRAGADAISRSWRLAL